MLVFNRLRNRSFLTSVRREKGEVLVYTQRPRQLDTVEGGRHGIIYLTIANAVSDILRCWMTLNGI